jgi:hypothetical protein
MLILLVPILVLNIVNCNSNLGIHKKFEYKYSFKPPYLAQKDGTVPFWEYGGSKLKKRKCLFPRQCGDQWFKSKNIVNFYL